ncbi:10738_t:CDS:2, partial [Cetraspora pellucida]
YGNYLFDKKFTKIEEYQDFINYNEHEWSRDISKKVVSDFIKYLYSKEKLTNHRCFDYNNPGRWEIVNEKIILYDENNNLIDFSRNRENQKTWERSDRDYIFKGKDEMKEVDGKIVIIKYKEVELKQVNEEDTTSYVKKFVASMKLIGVEVPKPRFKYIVKYIKGVDTVWERMILPERFNPKED